MADLEVQVHQSVRRLRASNVSAKEGVREFDEQAQPWEADKLFAQREIHPILDYWLKLLDAQFSSLSTGKEKVRSLRFANLRANSFANSLPLQPNVLLKQAVITLIAILGWLKLGLFLLIQLVIIAATAAVAIALIYLFIRIGLYLLGLLQGMFQNILQQIKAFF